jgi:hypothetical protein
MAYLADTTRLYLGSPISHIIARSFTPKSANPLFRVEFKVCSPTIIKVAFSEEREDSGSDGSKDDVPINPTHRCRCRRLPLACQIAHCASPFTGKTFKTKELLRLHIFCSHEPRTIVCAHRDCQGSPKRFNELGYQRHVNKQPEPFSFSGQVESSVPWKLRL